MRMRTPKEGSCDPIAPLELPHSLHAFHRVSQTDKLNVVCFLLISWLFCLGLNGLITVWLAFAYLLSINCWLSQEGFQTFRGGFWNYFSLGKNSRMLDCLYIQNSGVVSVCVPVNCGHNF